MFMLMVRVAIGVAYLAVPAAVTYRQLRRSSLTLRERAGLSLVLGPAIMALLVTAVRLAGASMQAAAWISFLFAGATLFIPGGPKATSAAPSQSDFKAGAAAAAVTLAWMSSFWVTDERMRIFNWHALMQIDICNSLARESLPPQEPEMAGLRCSYAWLVHCYWVAQAAVAGLSPTRLMVVNNVCWAGAQLLLGSAYARRLGLLPVTAWAAAVLAVIGTNSIVLPAAAFTTGLPLDWRLAPALGKFCNLDTMPLALPLFTALLVWAACDPRKSHVDTVVFFLTAIALALVYPVMLPAMAATVMAYCLSHFIASRSLGDGWSAAPAWPLPSPIPEVAMAFGVAATAAVWFVSMLSVDRATPGLRLLVPTTMDSALGGKLARLAMAVAPLVPFALISIGSRDVVPRLLDSRRSRHAIAGLVGTCCMAAMVLAASVVTKSHRGIVITIYATLLTGLAFGFLAKGGRRIAWWSGIACLLAYCVCDVEALEYKYVLAASIALAPFACEGITAVISTIPQRDWYCLYVVIVLAAATLYGGLVVGILVPDNLAAAPQVNEWHAQLQLTDVDPRAGWVVAVKTLTPPHTVVVSRNDAIHVAAFLDRPLYAPSDTDGLSQSGYSIASQQNMTNYRGHSLELYKSRRAAVKSLFEDDSRRNQALNEIFSVATPIAVHASPSDVGLCSLLQSTTHASVIFQNERDIVWLLHRPQ